MWTYDVSSNPGWTKHKLGLPPAKPCCTTTIGELSSKCDVSVGAKSRPLSSAKRVNSVVKQILLTLYHHLWDSDIVCLFRENRTLCARWQDIYRRAPFIGDNIIRWKVSNNRIQSLQVTTWLIEFFQKYIDLQNRRLTHLNNHQEGWKGFSKLGHFVWINIRKDTWSTSSESLDLLTLRMAGFVGKWILSLVDKIVPMMVERQDRECRRSTSLSIIYNYYY